MLARASAAGPGPTLRLGLGDGIWVVGALLAAAAAGELVANVQLLRILFAVVLLFLVVVVGTRAPRALLLALPVWLVPLGLLRRLFSAVSSGGATDPLLLVLPVMLIVLAIAALDRGAMRRPTTLSKLVAAYTVLVVLGAINPLQVSVKAGLISLIFFVPLLGFWIGRGLVDDALLKRLLILIGVLGIPAALYGLRQTFGGFPSWDQRWIAAQGYTSLSVGGVTRPFSTFSNAAEYATFLAICVVIWLRLGPRRMLRPIALGAAALLMVAAFYEASRSPIIMLLAALAVMLAAWRRLPLSVAAVLGALLLFAVPAVAKHFGSSSSAPTTAGTGTLVQHQVQGLSNPLDPNASTVGTHLSLIELGIKSAFTDPLGQGISVVTIAGSKFGGTTTSTEADPSNAALALGLPGLVAFLFLFGAGFRSAYGLARTGDRLAGVAVGLLTVTAMQWLNGGQYAVAFLPWVLLGWVDRRSADAGTDDDATVVSAAVAVLERPTMELRRPPEPPRLVEPAPCEQSSVEPLPPQPPPVRRPAPRVWSVDGLGRLPRLDDEQRFLLVYLREHASAQGLLPVAFDPLVRASFGPLLGFYDWEP